MRVAITGALSYTGRYLAKDALGLGIEVVNLSRRLLPIAVDPLTTDEVGELTRSRVAPAFKDAKLLAAQLEGCDVLFCTYWTRFAGASQHDVAVANCGALFDAAKAAGVQKIVFSSHTRAKIGSPYPYIDGKARANERLRSCGVNYAIVRPCGIFGDAPSESVLLNNAAWVVRRVPVFLVPGDGSHRFQPIHVRDMARLMLDLGLSVDTSGEERDACGPEAPTTLDLFTKLRDALGAFAAIVPVGNLVSTKAITALTRPINLITGDILLDADDLDLLCAGLTTADDPSDPAIPHRRSLFSWIDEHSHHLGTRYVSSIERYYYTGPLADPPPPSSSSAANV
ncbi:hypothetical protein CTAYLR_000933 [Chrysophaeum taylorii]|uniref:NAD(P)-binding domain-containing protein n=1 Tax=Chrysophaeum taylorii TaxID=2483200 RepID=A0AAD7UFX7_9STRA|nr:hypothetical protein CTAYLR_000933 [Chrysophaeum taylorii]